MTVGGTTIFGAATAPASGATTATTTFATTGTYTYNFAKGLTAGGGATTAFNYGTFNFGPTSASCTNGYAYSICNTSTLLTFEGPSTFTTVERHLFRRRHGADFGFGPLQQQLQNRKSRGRQRPQFRRRSDGDVWGRDLLGLCFPAQRQSC